MSPPLSLADRIRHHALSAITQAIASSDSVLADIRIRAGDIHGGMGLANRMPAVCSALESRKFAELSGCQLVRREGPHRGANAVFYFRPSADGDSIGGLLGESEPAAIEAPPVPAGLPPRKGIPSLYQDGETIYLVSCVKSKSGLSSIAQDLYTSDWFKKARSCVEESGRRWFILSAEYGLLAPSDVVAPYELTLNRMKSAERRQWAGKVLDSIKDIQPVPRRVVMLAGQRYREHIQPALQAMGVEVIVPMEGLRQGEQLSWLGEQTIRSTVAEAFPSRLPEAEQVEDCADDGDPDLRVTDRLERVEPMTSRAEDLKRFYDLLGKLELQLGGARRLVDCDGRMDWPARGVYFFFEPGEVRTVSGRGSRVVRVGTHALTDTSRTTLWKRLSQHRGSSRSGAGNHRGSIFRLLMGSAMKRRDGEVFPESWGVGSDPSAAAERLGCSREDIRTSEFDLECQVSAYIRSMPFLWLDVDDLPGSASSRGYIERTSIALLSNFSGECIDAASEGWLGRFADRPRVRASGLWNNNHVDEEYDPGFLDRLEVLIASSE